MDDSEEDQRKPHRQSPNSPASAEELHKVGVISWRLDADDPENDPALAAIRKVRHCLRNTPDQLMLYPYVDIIICGQTLPSLLGCDRCGNIIAAFILQAVYSLLAKIQRIERLNK